MERFYGFKMKKNEVVRDMYYLTIFIFLVMIYTECPRKKGKNFNLNISKIILLT